MNATTADDAKAGTSVSDFTAACSAMRRLARCGAGGLLLAATAFLSACGITVLPSTSSSAGAATTTTVLSVSSTSVTVGTTITLTATVSPSGTTGNVNFYDGTVSLGTGSFTSGSASLRTNSLSAGTHTLTASYLGSATYSASTSTAVTVTVTTSSSATWSSGACGYGTAAYVLSSGTLAESGHSYTASNTDESAICTTGSAAILSLDTPAITTSGATSSTDNSSFYGLDAAVLDYNGNTLTIKGGTVSTTGQGANDVFSYGTGVVTITDTTVKATGSNGHGLYAAGGGTMVVNNVTATTAGASGSVVATDRGGGTITVTGGSYSAAGPRSAGIYSTGAVTATNATFSATNAEAAVIEGSNTVTLNGSALTAVSATSEHRGIFLYQSTSGDATNSTCGTGACFTMTGGTFTYLDTTNSSTDATANCSAFTVANQVAHFILTDVSVSNTCPTLLLSALNTNWNYKGGAATFKAYGETLTGSVIVDAVSTADLYLYASSNAPSQLTGAINTGNTGQTVNLTLDSTSKWVVTGTSYLTALADANSSYGNITCQTSGCKVYVAGSAISIH